MSIDGLPLRKTGIEYFNTCPQKFQYAYIDQRVPLVDAPELRYGTYWHDYFMEPHFQGREPQIGEIFDGDALQLEKLKLLYAGYKQYYAVEDDDGPYQTEVEVEIREEGEEEALFRSRVDALGQRCFYEHKTTKVDLNNPGIYFEKLRTDWQVGLYQLATGKPCIYNVARVPQQRQGKREPFEDYLARISADISENPANYFARVEIRWSAKKLSEIYDDLRYLVAAVRDSTFYRSRNCFTYNRKCDYYSVCWDGADLQDNNLYKIRVQR